MFTPAFFRPREVPKHWDIISITRTSRFKNTDQLLDCLRLVYDRRPGTRTLVVCAGVPKPDRSTHHVDLRARYERLFSIAERERCTFLETRTGMFPFAREDVAFLYNASRIFTLFTDTEGVAKVVNEALLSGCGVVVKRSLRGGGADYLTPENSRTFDSVEQGANALVDAVEHADSINVDATALAREVSETYTLPRFEAALVEMFDQLGLPFQGEIVKENLSRKLPAHELDMVPRSMRRPLAADLASSEALLRWTRAILDRIPFEAVRFTTAERAQLRAWDAAGRLRRVAGGVRRRLARVTLAARA